MGSKGVLLSGIALIVGIYAVGIKKADNLVAGSAGTHAYRTQSELDSRMGIRVGIHYLRSWVDGQSSGIYATGQYILGVETIN